MIQHRPQKLKLELMQRAAHKTDPRSKGRSKLPEGIGKEFVMGRPVVHWELMSKDPAKVAAFYEKIFGWKIQHMPEMDYRLVETGGAGRSEERRVGKESAPTEMTHAHKRTR